MPRTDPQFKLRLPPGLKERLDAAALEANRTTTAEIVHRLEQSFLSNAAPATLPETANAVAAWATLYAMADRMLRPTPDGGEKARFGKTDFWKAMRQSAEGHIRQIADGFDAAEGE